MVADFLYPDWNDELVVLEIDPNRVRPQIRVESAYDAGLEFPHIYGPLSISAVTAVRALAKEDKDNRWRLRDHENQQPARA